MCNVTYGLCDEQEHILWQNAPNFDSSYFRKLNSETAFDKEEMLDFNVQISEVCVDKILRETLLGSSGLSLTSKIFVLEQLEIKIIEEMGLLEFLDKVTYNLSKVIEYQMQVLEVGRVLQSKISHSTSKSKK